MLLLRNTNGNGHPIVANKPTVSLQRSSVFNRLWRWIATGLFFALFGIGGLALSLVWFTLLRLTVRQQDVLQQFTHASIRYSFRFFINALRLAGVMDYQIIGAEKFKQD